MWLLVRGDDSFRRVGGRTLLERIALQLRLEGVRRATLWCAAPTVSRAEAAVAGTGLETRVAQLEEMFHEIPAGPLLLIETDRVYDRRLLHLGLVARRPLALVDHRTPLATGPSFVGVARLHSLARPTAVVQRPASAVIDAALAGALRKAPVDACRAAGYVAELRRFLRPYWQRVRDDRQARRAGWLLARAASKGHMEWPVVLVHRPVEVLLSRLLMDTPVTPNALTLAGVAVAAAATAGFISGHLLLGCGLAVVAQIVDGLDGRQARVQLRHSPVGRWEHVLDKLAESAWVLSLTWYFARSGVPRAWPWGLSWLATLHAANGAGAWFRSRRGCLPEETSRIDAAIRFLGARRNTNTFLFAAGVLFDRAATAFTGVAVFQVLTCGLLWLRAVRGVRRGQPCPGGSPTSG